MFCNLFPLMKDSDIAGYAGDNIPYEMLCAIWHHLYNLKNVKNTHGGLLLLLLDCQTLVWNLTKINTPPWVFFTLFRLYKWNQIA